MYKVKQNSWRRKHCSRSVFDAIHSVRPQELAAAVGSKWDRVQTPSDISKYSFVPFEKGRYMEGVIKGLKYLYNSHQCTQLNKSL